MTSIVLVLASSAVVNLAISAPNETYAIKTTCECTNTYSDGTTVVEEGADSAIFGDSNGCYCGGVRKVIQFVIDTFTIGVVLLATIGIIWVGYLYMTARDNQEQVSKAKRRFVEIAIGLVVFVLLDLITSLFLPGGMLSGAPSVVSTSSERIEVPEEELKPPDNAKPGGGGGSPSKPSNPGDSPGSSDDKRAKSVSEAVWENGNECSAKKVFEGKKYALTNEEIKYFSELVAIENCRSESSKAEVKLGCRLLATQIINLYEERKHDRGSKVGCSSGGSCYYKDLKKWITHDKWYAVNHHGGMSPGKYSNSNSRAAVIDVIVNGNRAMPKFVSRYDGLNHWTNPSYSNSSYLGLNSISEAAKAVPMKTKVKPGERYLWCIERKQTSNKYNGPYNEVFNYDNNYRKAVGM